MNNSLKSFYISNQQQISYSRSRVGLRARSYSRAKKSLCAGSKSCTGIWDSGGSFPVVVGIFLDRSYTASRRGRW
jgi:hypothetical protein